MTENALHIVIGNAAQPTRAWLLHFKNANIIKQLFPSLHRALCYSAPDDAAGNALAQSATVQLDGFDDALSLHVLPDDCATLFSDHFDAHLFEALQRVALVAPPVEFAACMELLPHNGSVCLVRAPPRPILQFDNAVERVGAILEGALALLAFLNYWLASGSDQQTLALEAAFACIRRALPSQLPLHEQVKLALNMMHAVPPKHAVPVAQFVQQHLVRVDQYRFDQDDCLNDCRETLQQFCTSLPDMMHQLSSDESRLPFACVVATLYAQCRQVWREYPLLQCAPAVYLTIEDGGTHASLWTASDCCADERAYGRIFALSHDENASNSQEEDDSDVFALQLAARRWVDALNRMDRVRVFDHANGARRDLATEHAWLADAPCFERPWRAFAVPQTPFLPDDIIGADLWPFFFNQEPIADAGLQLWLSGGAASRALRQRRESGDGTYSDLDLYILVPSGLARPQVAASMRAAIERLAAYLERRHNGAHNLRWFRRGHVYTIFARNARTPLQLQVRCQNNVHSAGACHVQTVLANYDLSHVQCAFGGGARAPLQWTASVHAWASILFESGATVMRNTGDNSMPNVLRAAKLKADQLPMVLHSLHWNEDFAFAQSVWAYSVPRSRNQRSDATVFDDNANGVDLAHLACPWSRQCADGADSLLAKVTARLARNAHAPRSRPAFEAWIQRWFLTSLTGDAVASVDYDRVEPTFWSPSQLWADCAHHLLDDCAYNDDLIGGDSYSLSNWQDRQDKWYPQCLLRHDPDAHVDFSRSTQERLTRLKNTTANQQAVIHSACGNRLYLVPDHRTHSQHTFLFCNVHVRVILDAPYTLISFACLKVEQARALNRDLGAAFDSVFCSPESIALHGRIQGGLGHVLDNFLDLFCNNRPCAVCERFENGSSDQPALFFNGRLFFFEKKKTIARLTWIKGPRKERGFYLEWMCEPSIADALIPAVQNRVTFDAVADIDVCLRAVTREQRQKCLHGRFEAHRVFFKAFIPRAPEHESPVGAKRQKRSPNSSTDTF